MANNDLRLAVEKAIDGDVAGFKESISDILLAKSKEAIELRRIDVASSMMEEGYSADDLADEDKDEDDETKSLEPKAKKEKELKGKHPVSKKDHPVADDKQFKG